ncbi:hypothetical protein SeMB42_g06619 [Synchytrium endobioticum]|uniref:Uncharacterized protein n=1 Tax=Synchytrium endobioticum TaxID=286115 RepID=A0A507CJY0_9FUNG|nr:hypothetical protein SeMB42_g06619 [Synchytrium endobioticum]TPX46445.1 hypothetical protein SeLEV6574_g03229 [Synchytrium endobioticum]
MPVLYSPGGLPQWDQLQARLRTRERTATDPATFKRSSTGDEALVGRLTLSQRLSAHTGCVNALSWNQGGDLLVSGSDDTHLCLWRYSPGPSASAAQKSQLLARFPTGHRANIFSAKFVPGTSDNVVVCCAGDGDVRVFDVAYASSRQVLRSAYSCHRDRAKRIVTLPDNPSVFLSCGEDGTVRRFDLRTPHRCSASNSAGYDASSSYGSRTGCPAAIINLSTYAIELNGISLSHLNTNYIVLGGSDPHLLLYDLRSTISPVSRFRPPGINKNGNITSVKFSQHNGREVIGSWHNDYVYLYDISQSDGIGDAVRPTDTFRNSIPRHRDTTEPTAAPPTTYPNGNTSSATDQLSEAFTNAAAFFGKEQFEDAMNSLNEITTFLQDMKPMSNNNKKVYTMACRNKAKVNIAWAAHNLHMRDVNMDDTSNNNNSTDNKPPSPLKRKREATANSDIPALMLAHSAPSSPPQTAITLGPSTEEGETDVRGTILQGLLDAASGYATIALDLDNGIRDTTNVNKAILLRVVAYWGLGVVDAKEVMTEQIDMDLKGVGWPIEEDALADAVVDATNGVKSKDPAEWIRYCHRHMTSLEVPIFLQETSNGASARTQEWSDLDGKLVHVVAGAESYDQDDAWDEVSDSNTVSSNDEEEAEDTDEEYEGAGPSAFMSRRTAFPHSELITEAVKIFKGHINNQTVKDCNFLGHDSSLVVVNVIEGHPFLPAVAVSGIDSTVKIFESIYPKRAGESIDVDQVLSSNEETMQNNEATDDNDESNPPRRRRRGMGLSRSFGASVIPSLTRPFTSHNSTTTFPDSTFASETGLSSSSSLLYKGSDIVREAEDRRKDQGELVISRSMLRALINTGSDGAPGAGEEAGDDGDENCPIQ